MVQLFRHHLGWKKKEIPMICTNRMLQQANFVSVSQPPIGVKLKHFLMSLHMTKTLQ